MNDFRAKLAVDLLAAGVRRDREFDPQYMAVGAVKAVDEVLKACGIDKGEGVEEVREQLKQAESLNAVLSYKIGVVQSFYEEILAVAEGRASWQMGSKDFWTWMRRVRDALTETEFTINKTPDGMKVELRPKAE